MKERRIAGRLTLAAVLMVCFVGLLAVPGRLVSLPSVNEGEWRSSPDPASRAFCASKYEVVNGICVDWWMVIAGEEPENSGLTCCIAAADRSANSFSDCIEGLR